MAYKLVWLAEALSQAGLKVAEVNGWKDRGRSEMGTVRGVMCYHTAGPALGNMPSLRILVEGRADLAGPLSQLGLGRDGTWYVIAAGRANHAGKGNWQGFTSGNSSFIGIEAEHTGRKTDPWPEIQLESYRRGAAALLKHIGADAIMCCGHKEYALPQGRKPDPINVDMNDFRFRVAAIMNGAAPAPNLIPAADAQNRPTIRRGSSGDWVREAQKALKLDVSGVFDALMEAAVRVFQRKKGLVPDGIVGPRTWASL